MGPGQPGVLELKVTAGGRDHLPVQQATDRMGVLESNVMGELTKLPACPIHPLMPCPRATWMRCGNVLSRVAISMAVETGLRNGTGSRPVPIRSRCVQARAHAALAIAP